ncbi:MAG: hypothetical protein QF862_06020, partial [Prochlorococcaceae cyanobacterium ETNP7_MAG_30]|nr:hypothetical protein [Prochlorococcaceae cyanobacterium ETNP7_MAG_30]
IHTYQPDPVPTLDFPGDIFEDFTRWIDLANSLKSQHRGISTVRPSSRFDLKADWKLPIPDPRSW